MQLEASRPARLITFSPVAWARRYSMQVALAAVTAATFGVYVSTLAPTVMWYDMGEFATVSATLGIAHNTGYPLLILLGKLFTFLPAGDAAYRVNLLSAVATTLAVAVTFSIIHDLADDIAGASVGALLLAFSGTVWADATWATSYGLNLLLTALVARFMLLWWRERSTAALAAAALALGLGLCNHRLIVLVAPPAAIVLFAGRASVSRRDLAIATLSFLLALSLYFYLPIRGAQHPALSWAQPANWHTYWSMFLTGQTPAEYWRIDLADRIDVLWTYPAYDLSWPALALASIGLLACLQRMRLLAVCVLVMLLLDVAIVETYSIHNIYNYLTPAYLVLAMLAGIGSARIISFARDVRLSSVRPSLRIACAVLVLALVPLSLFARHHARVDRSSDYAARDFAHATLDLLPPRAVVLADTWTASPLWYLQMVEGQRRDVLVSPVLSVPGEDVRSFTRSQLDQGRPVFAVEGLRDPHASLGTAFHLRPVMLDSVREMVTTVLPKPEYRDTLVASGSLYAVLADAPPEHGVADAQSGTSGDATYPGLTLVGSAISSPFVWRGGSVVLTYNWRVDAPLSPDLTAATIFVDTQGRVANVAGQPEWSQKRVLGEGMVPTGGWQAGDVVRESYVSLVPRSIAAGRYEVRIAVFDRANARPDAPLHWFALGAIDVR